MADVSIIMKRGKHMTKFSNLTNLTDIFDKST